MNLIEWTEGNAVDVKVIDEQHQQMVKTVNELYSLLGSHKNEAIKFLIRKLVNETKIHFGTEEKLMKEGQYKWYISHKLEHDRFENDINSFYSEFTKGEINVNLEFLKNIKKWFFNHIEINDRKLGVHINSLENKEDLLKQFEAN